jgi:hypothetical protein
MDNEYGNVFLDKKLHSGTPEGLSIETHWNNDQAESKTFRGSVDCTVVEPAPCSVKIRIGYDVFSRHDSAWGNKMIGSQAVFTRDSTLHTINSLEDFRQAVVDGYIHAEKMRIDEVNKIIDENDISTGDTPEKRKQWGRAQKYLRLPRPALHIFLERTEHGKSCRVYIMTKNCSWHWGGFSDVLKIDFQDLYKQLLKTEQHCKNLDSLVGAICEGVK